MTSDTARRLAEEKYPHYIAPSWEDGATKGDVMPSVDASWQDAEADMQRAAFLAGWEARGAISEEMVEAMATAFAQSIHGEDADQQDADYYAEHLRAALGGDS